jgi:pimeloyl-ACP methyl ester carboxylesterase
LAVDLYNAALVEAFRGEDPASIALAGGVYRLPFGELELDFPPEELQWAGRELLDLTPVAELEIHGIRNRYRLSGIGAPLAARTVAPAGAPPDPLVGPRVRIALTAVLRVAEPRRALAEKRIRGSLEIYAANDTEQITLDGETLPLQYEDTAALAVTLAQPGIWDRELAGFFGRVEGDDELPALRIISPHRRSRIPVVFVHGTASSPGRWADMFNDLWSARSIRERFEPWFFMYDTGNPIPYSAAGLRDLLTAAVGHIDPAGNDTCLRQMVVVGHSQGGLLTKLTAVEGGDVLWNAVARKPLDELPLSEATRTLLRSSLFPHPLPFVTRVVFIATPHRGSYQALRSISGWVTRFVRMPRKLLSAAGDLATLQADGVVMATRMKGLPTSVDNMREGNPFLMALLSLPIAPGIAKHSIIPVLGDAPFEDGKDGVVAYRSAHLDEVDSELVVKSGHSTQSEPATIEEVRRILGVHADAVLRAGIRCGPDAAPAAR